jgi:hypothetical protein
MRWFGMLPTTALDGEQSGYGRLDMYVWGGGGKATIV